MTPVLRAHLALVIALASGACRHAPSKPETAQDSRDQDSAAPDSARPDSGDSHTGVVHTGDSSPPDSGDSGAATDSGDSDPPDSGDSAAATDSGGSHPPDSGDSAAATDSGDSAPAAEEICDGVDNDGDGLIDEDLTQIWYTDADGDGYGDETTAVEACAAGAGQVATGGDCDDSDADVHPGAEELTDGLDSDCAGPDASTDSDGDGLSDLDEDEIYRTDPDSADTDGDGALDGDEVAAATDPVLADDEVPDPDADDDGACDSALDAVIFEASDGTLSSLSAAFWATSSAPVDVSLSDEGTLWICGGTHYVRLSTTSTLTVVGDGDTTLDAVDTGVTLSASGDSLVLERVRLTRGDGSTGGCVYFGGSTLQLDGVEIDSCTALHGAGLYSAAGEVTISDSSFTSNGDPGDYTSANFGGAIFLAHSDATLDGVTVSGNTTGRGGSLSYGGGIYQNGGTLTLTNSTITGNKAYANYWAEAYGGGVYSDGDVSVTDSEISSNQAGASPCYTGQGGGLYVAGTLSLDGATINSNTTKDKYGLTYGAAYYATTSTIVDSTIRYNDAMSYYWVIVGTGTCTNSTVSDNTPADTSSGSLAACASGTVTF